jgi:hypothetical protein
MSRQVSPEQAPVLPAHPATAQTAQTTQPVQQQQQQPPTVQPIVNTTVAPESHSLREKLNAGDEHWQWKLGLRAILVIIGIIGIGCAAWTLVKFGPGKNPYDYELDDAWTMPFTLITFCISLAWSLACILVFFMRRPNAPVHPGAQVGMDLVLWLAFIPTAMCAVIAVSSVASMGQSGQLGGLYSSRGYYTFSPENNTWAWNTSASSSYSSSYGSTRDCMKNSTSSSRYNYGTTFTNCTEEDLYVNDLWKGKSQRFSTELTATVCQFLGLLLHLVLFIWACVDTHRRNSRKVSKDAEKLAAEIVMKMVQTGAIVPAPGAVHTRPMPGQMPPQMMQQGHIPPHMMQQMFPQQFSEQHSQQHYGHFAPQQFAAPTQPVVASSSNEKGAGSRFA